MMGQVRGLPITKVLEHRLEQKWQAFTKVEDEVKEFDMLNKVKHIYGYRGNYRRVMSYT